VPGAPGAPGAPDNPGSAAASRMSVPPTSILSRVRLLFGSGTAAPGDASVPQFPPVTPPRPTQQLIGVISPVPTRGHGMPTPIESPTVPSSPSWDGGADSGLGIVTTFPRRAHEPAVPASDDEIHTIPGPFFSTKTPTMGPPPSLAPVFVPDLLIPPRQWSPPVFVHTPPQPPPSQLGRTPSPPRPRSAPPHIPSRPTIIVPPQSDVIHSAIPSTSTKPVYAERSDESGLADGSLWHWDLDPTAAI
jgi:hypothetical protein